ncbi:MAG: DUF3267 domain-containing protein [Bacteroidetes bacterium]|nr:DUF3267 domain-containing protein [Bacteroidota bacterium]
MKTSGNKIQVSDLEDERRFRLITSIEHENVVPFVFRYIWKKNKVTCLYFGVNIIFLAYLLRIITFQMIPGSWSPGATLWQLFLGFILYPVLLVPVHEGIHGLVYLLEGATKIKFGADLKQYIFYVTADHFVLNRNSFYRLAFTPFIILSLALAACSIFIQPPYSWGFSLCLLAHGTMCIGDFALASLFAEYPEKEIYTYDQASEKTSFFYEKIISK